jgi:hypothetical protein
MNTTQKRRRFSILSVIKAINAAGFAVYHEAKTTNKDTVLYISKDTNSPLIELEKAISVFNGSADLFQWALIKTGYPEYAPELTRLYVIVRKGKS